MRTTNQFLEEALLMFWRGLSSHIDSISNGEIEMPVYKTKYYPYNSEKAHGMEAIEYASAWDAALNKNGKVVDSVFFKAYDDTGALAKPISYPLGLTGFDYKIDADGKDADVIPEWFFEFKIVDKDGDFTGQYLEIDTNPGSAFAMVNLYVDPMTGDLVGLNSAGVQVIIDGTFSADGTELTYRIDNEVLQDMTGLDGTVLGKFGWEHWGDNGASSYGQVELF